MPAALYFASCETGYVIEPVYRTVISEPVNHHQARLLWRDFLEQNIVASHIDAEDDQVVEQVLPEFIEVRQKFGERVALLEMPPQRPGNTAIIIRDQIDDKTLSQVGFQLPVILRNMFEIAHLASCQTLVEDEFAPGLLVTLTFLYLDYLARVFGVQVTGALLADPDRFAGNLQYLLLHRVGKDITNRRD